MDGVAGPVSSRNGDRGEATRGLQSLKTRAPEPQPCLVQARCEALETGRPSPPGLRPDRPGAVYHRAQTGRPWASGGESGEWCTGGGPWAKDRGRVQGGASLEGARVTDRGRVHGRVHGQGARAEDHGRVHGRIVRACTRDDSAPLRGVYLGLGRGVVLGVVRADSELATDMLGIRPAPQWSMVKWSMVNGPPNRDLHACGRC